ncbi:MAG: HAMP domain-containing sensor histidine kinase [Pseudomonadota bacterium]
MSESFSGSALSSAGEAVDASAIGHPAVRDGGGRTWRQALGGAFERLRAFFPTVRRAPFDAPGAFVVTVDDDARIVAAPRRWRDRFALAPCQGVGGQSSSRAPAVEDALLTVFLPEERERLAEAVRSRAVGATLARARKADGTTGVFDLHCARRTDGKTDILIVDASLADGERQALADAGAQARAEAKSSAAALADLSHEMKTPLNAVIGFADAMDAETFGPLGHAKYKEYADHIRASGKHLLDLVVSILDMARLDAERLQLSPVLCRPDALAKECAAMVRQTAEKAGLKLTLDIDDSVSESLMDPRAVRQVLINLLSNAIKFTSDGEVRLSLSTVADEVVFEVADTGIGMNTDDLAKLGPRFTAAHGSGVRGADGAGLGLALAFRLADLHGGRLDLQSAPGEGLTARLILPRKRAAHSKASSREDSLDRVQRKLTDGATTPTEIEVESPIPAPAPVPAPAARTKLSEPADQLTQLERIEAYRREVAEARAASAA